MGLKFISQRDFSYELCWQKVGLWMKYDFALKRLCLLLKFLFLGVEKWNFWKTQHSFPYIASGTHGDYISIVFFVLVGCALQEKMQLSKGPWHDIVMVHPLLEIAAQRACLVSVLCPCFARCPVYRASWQCFRDYQTPLFLILIIIFLKWGCCIALLFCLF